MAGSSLFAMSIATSLRLAGKALRTGSLPVSTEFDMNMPWSTGKGLAATHNPPPAEEPRSGTTLITLVPTVFGSMSLAAVLGILATNLMLTHLAHSGSPQLLMNAQLSRVAVPAAPQWRSQPRPSAAYWYKPRSRPVKGRAGPDASGSSPEHCESAKPLQTGPAPGNGQSILPRPPFQCIALVLQGGARRWQRSAQGL
jgi:hypothetical protein